MGFINSSKKIIIFALLVILAGGAIKIIGIDMLWGKFKAQAEQIIQLEQSKKDITKYYQDHLSTVTTLNTVEKEKLKKEYDEHYTKIIDSLKEKLTGVYTGTGNVHIEDSLIIPEIPADKDSIFVSNDFFVFTFFNDTLRNPVYTFDANILLTGIETTDKTGNKRIIENAFLVSNRTGKKVALPWKASYTYLKPKIKLWHWWNPKLQSDVVLGSPIKFGGSFNIMSYGKDTNIENTHLYIMSFGIASDFKDKTLLTFSPIKYNIGQILPLISNLNIGPGVCYDLSNSSFAIYFSIGMVH